MSPDGVSPWADASEAERNTVRQGAVQRTLVAALVACVRFYQQTLHGFFGYGCCRFSPTCSQYMIEALETHGLFKGLGLGLWRIVRCNPFCRGGYDPVPPATK